MSNFKKWLEEDELLRHLIEMAGEYTNKSMEDVKKLVKDNFFKMYNRDTLFSSDNPWWDEFRNDHDDYQLAPKGSSQHPGQPFPIWRRKQWSPYGDFNTLGDLIEIAEGADRPEIRQLATNNLYRLLKDEILPDIIEKEQNVERKLSPEQEKVKSQLASYQVPKDFPESFHLLRLLDCQGK